MSNVHTTDLVIMDPMYQGRVKNQVEKFFGPLFKKYEKTVKDSATFVKGVVPVFECPQYYFAEPKAKNRFGRQELQITYYNVYSMTNNEGRVANFILKFTLYPEDLVVNVNFNHMLSANYPGVKIFNETVISKYMTNTYPPSFEFSKTLEKEINSYLKEFKKINLNTEIEKSFIFTEEVNIDVDIILDWSGIGK